MISGSALSLALLVAVSASVPHLLSRASLRERLIRLDALATIVLLGLWHVAAILEVDVGAGEACGLFLAAKIVLFATMLSRDDELDEVEWSASRAGLLVGLVYLALVPNALVWPTDGDESFYVLGAESVIQDFDLDLRNQYAGLDSSVTGRLDIGPQFGDPVGANGELYSRHEPLLSLVLIPGILLGGLAGAVVTIALLAALAIRAITALLDEEGASRRLQLLVVAFVGLAPPFLNYAVRIWPEAPGALLLAEMLRAARARKIGRMAVLGVVLSALKLRFVPIAVVLLAIVLLSGRVRRRWIVAGFAGVAGILGLAWIFIPGVFAARVFDPRTVFVPDNFARGLLGILLDGQAGLLFQAPLFLVATTAVLRWRSLGQAARLGCLTAIPYLFLLLPRSEWHGGWSPPLRYLIVFAPVFALLLASAIEQVVRRSAVIVAVAWTAGLAASAVMFPPGQFRIASGESALGEHLSRLWGADFSRLLPSLIRPNEASMWAGIVLVLVATVVALRRGPRVEDRGPITAAVLSVVLAATAWAGLQPGSVIEFEDGHVVHRGGELYPERWTVARFRFRGGWALQPDDSLIFRHRGGMVTLEYYCDQPTVIEVDGEAYDVPTGSDYADISFLLPETGGDRHEIRCLTGALILDRLSSE